MNNGSQNAYLTRIATEQVNEQSARLDSLNGQQIAALMNQMDAQVSAAVAEAVEPIGLAIEEIAKRLQRSGRLFYIGAGTSGRLGVLDASECPPTFGVTPDMIQGIIAGGDRALRHALEGAEDDAAQSRRDLMEKGLKADDTVVAISASGYAPYCVGALDYARELGALAISLCCNVNTILSNHADIAIEVPTGAEVLMGSTRLKAGTATKMVLNMLSTGAMVRTGRVYKNLMVDMRASNSKLRDRAARIVGHATGADFQEAQELIVRAKGNTKAAIVMKTANVNLEDAEGALQNNEGWISKALQELGAHT